ncbi:hypothetical protein DXA95_03605 [Odoribacter sp. OF09-27XD]|nr:hypothetical protein DXA95_03605 [Odoribacter sp. OF09-27XD]
MNRITENISTGSVKGNFNNEENIGIIYVNKNTIFAEKSKIRPFPEIVNLQFLPTSFLSFKSLFQGI